MEIRTHTEQGTLIVEVTGRLDAATGTVYVERLRQELASGSLHLVIDCSGLEYVSSAGLRAFLLVSKDLIRIGGSESYCGLRQQVLEIFRISGFASIIRIHDTCVDALQPQPDSLP
jgi:anti-anti-sigma factor